eukprot:g4979.t1
MEQVHDLAEDWQEVLDRKRVGEPIEEALEALRQRRQRVAARLAEINRGDLGPRRRRSGGSQASPVEELTKATEESQVLRDGLRGLVEGSLKVEHNFVATIYGVSLDWSESKREALHQGYLFLDLCSLPQILDLGTGSVDFTNTDASLAVQSIPAYVERCDLFIALAPDAWKKRVSEWPTDVANDSQLPIAIPPMCCLTTSTKRTRHVLPEQVPDAHCGWPVHSGRRPCRSDTLGGRSDGQEDQAPQDDLTGSSRPDDLHWYRYFVALRNRWVGQPNRSGSLRMSTLLELKADIHARSWMGVNSLFLARSAEQVAVLLEAKETVVALLEARCDPNPELAGAGFGPLHAAGLFSRGNPEALDMARLLIMQRADVNVPARPTMLFGICGLSQSRANLCGFDACPARTRFFASLPGLTPLGIAASVGSETLVNLLLEHRAEPEQPNGRGDVPRYLALANGHKHVYALLEDTFSI